MKHLITFLCIFLSFSLYSQNDRSKLINTSWAAGSHNITSTEEEVPINTTIWRDVFDNKSSIKFNADGTLDFTIDDAKQNSMWKVEDGTLLIYVTDHEGKTSYTRYEYVMSGSNLTLKIEDPIIKARYTFKSN